VKQAGRAPGGDKAKSPAKRKSAAHTKQGLKGKSAERAAIREARGQAKAGLAGPENRRPQTAGDTT
jgi:hypothetical protein